MNKRFQDISFRVSRYFRPLEPWHCGGLENGEQCLLGPNKKGTCRAITDCTPDKVDKTWMCTRSDLQGGNCKTGPNASGVCGHQRPPCQPVRNLRSRRMQVAWLALAIVMAVTAIGVVFDFWRTPSNPGSLSQQHIAFGSENCASCHRAADMPRSQWLGSIFGSHAGAVESQRCTSCHSLGDTPQNIHSLSSVKLAELTQAAEQSENNSGASLLVGFGRIFTGESQAPNCSVCHKEHGGVKAPITHLSDQQCAVCHTNTFSSLENHHDFVDYPAAKRTPIIFSHNTHLGKHFVDEDNQQLAPDGCMNCHITDTIGRKMELTGFDASCSGCHLKQITGESRAAEKGFAMLSFPALDTDTLKDRGVDLGEWPSASDAEFTALNLLLVAATDSSLKKDLQKFSDLNLYDLSSASDADLELVYRVMWTLKKVYFEMQRGGAKIILDRLNTQSNENSEQIKEIIGLLSPDIIDSATRAAFPNLEAEVLKWLEFGQPRFTVKAGKKTKPVAVSNSDTGSESQESNDADDDWLSQASDESGDDDDWLNEASGEDSDDDDWLSSATDDDQDDGDDWLNDATDSDSDDDWLDSESDDTATAFEEDDPVVEELAPNAIVSQLSLEDRAAAGGWYFEDFYLRYRPSGHADRLIVAWVDLMMSNRNTESILSNSMVIAMMGKSAPGSCIKCHSVDVEKRGDIVQRKVNWHGTTTKPSTHSFNRFAHNSHFGVITTSAKAQTANTAVGCRACHILDSDADSSEAYEGDGQQHSDIFESDFFDMDKQQCADCHANEAALANCTQCHNYHIGERGLVGIEDGFQMSIKSNVDKPIEELEKTE